MVLQSILDLESFGPIGNVILENAAYKFLLEGKAYSQAVNSKILDYSGLSVDLLTSVKNNPPRYSEMFIDTPFGHGVARLVVDSWTYWIATSQGEEVAQFNNLVKDGKAQACVSAGNTGALMGTAKFVLKMLPGIDRPAIITELPAKGGSLHMLDLGANTLCTADHLFQFAVMGSIITADITGVERPRVALLNIGAEDSKGHDTVKNAATMLNASTLNYVGFIEGSELFSGKADVVVTDGFTGNVALKTMEGTVGLAAHYLKRAFTRNVFAKLQALLSRSVLKHLASRMDPRKYNGATLVGLNGIVIKSHGSADSFAFEHAIETAVVEVQNQVPQQIGNLLQQEAA